MATDARGSEGETVIDVLLATLWLWEAPECSPDVVAYRVHTIYLHQVASVPDMDDDGNVYASPIYSPWAELMLYQGTDQWVDDMCQPERGAVCIVKVEALDEAGNVDEGANCS